MHREKYSVKKLTLPPLAAFDFETKGLGGDFIVAAIWTNDDERALFTNLREFFDWIIDHPQYRYLAHNAVGYEFAYLAPLLYDFFASNDNVDIHPTIQGDTRIVQFVITITDEEQRTRRGKPTKTIIDIRDTLCLFNMSLAKVAQAFCPELPKLEGTIDFDKEDFDVTNPSHIAYVFRDCEIVLRAYERHDQNIKDVFHSPLGVTAGSTALKAFKACIPAGHVYYRTNKDAENFIRKAYYGGLVLPGHQIGEWGPIGSVDVNGAYAFQMKSHVFPVGSPYATHFEDPDNIGFYHVIATVPPSVFDNLGFNPVPKREKEGLSWPTGTFDTYISTPEIEYARKKGCTIEVMCGYVFTRKEAVFDEFVDKCQEMEIFENFRYKPSIKQIRNSGYGKFGSRETHQTLQFSRETLPGFKPVMIEKTGERIEGLYVGEEKTDADYMLPHWAALITAYERLYIMEGVELAYARGATNVYCDTDSIKCDLPVLCRIITDAEINIGDRYGQYKVEDTCSSFLMLGSKCFYGVPYDSVSKPLIKAKGVPNRILKMRDYTEALEALNRPAPKTKSQKKAEEDRELHFISVKSVMSIIKEKSSVRPIKRKRKITDIRNSYAWQYSKSGRIYPKGYPIKEEGVGNRSEKAS